nr:hypothetical protein [Tanacetum cinerariifolium]
MSNLCAMNKKFDLDLVNIVVGTLATIKSFKKALESVFYEAYKLHSPINSTTTPPFTSTNELIHDCNTINTETHHHQTPLPPNAATIVSHKVKGLAGPRLKKQKEKKKEE